MSALIKRRHRGTPRKKRERSLRHWDKVWDRTFARTADKLDAIAEIIIREHQEALDWLADR